MALATASLSRPYVLCQPCSAARPLHAGKSLAASASGAVTTLSLLDHDVWLVSVFNAALHYPEMRVEHSESSSG